MRNDLLKTLTADLYRYTGRRGLLCGLMTFLFIPGFSCTFWYRLNRWRCRTRFRRLAFWWVWLMCKRSVRIWHVHIEGDIGGGLCVGHAEGGGVIINDKVKIGKNCNIHHGVTIGVKNRGKNLGVPTIGDNVYIGPGAKVFGGITIGDNVAIGANAVVVTSIPDNAVVVGVPGRIVSYNGSEDLVNRKV